MKHIVLPAILVLLCACGRPAGKPESPPQPAAHVGQNLRMDRFLMRFQLGGLRTIEISGDSAALSGSDRVNMDSVALTFYRDNLEFLRLTARTAQTRMTGAKDSGAVSLTDAAGHLHYGGLFRAETLKISFEDGTWRSTGTTVFKRLPLDVSAQSAYGPLSMDLVHAKDANIRAEGSSAFGDLMQFSTDQRLIFLQGRAGYISDTISLRADTMVLQIDPTYSRISPVKIRRRD